MTAIVYPAGAAVDMLKEALSYARRGWHVFPVHSRRADGSCTCSRKDCTRPAKHPLTKHGLKEATTDETVIRGWWARWPWANIAVRTGAESGLVVLDIDNHLIFPELDRSETGEDSLRALEREHGELPKTVQAITGGGGRHIFFKHPGGVVPCKTGLRPGLDIRADGGYIVAPGSVHITNRRYEWDVEHHPDDLALAEPPPWLLGLIKKREPARTGSDAGAAAAEAPIPAGRRNSELTSLAGSMRRRGMTADEIETALLAVNAKRCTPPLADDEVRRIAESVARYNPAAPAAITDTLVTDLTNAQRLVAEHGQDLRFCHPWGKWLVWDGRRWRQDDTAEVMRRAKETVRSMYAQAAVIADGETRKRFLKDVIESESRARLNAMVALAASEPGIPVLPDELDQDPWLLNVANGALDLRTGELRPHRREDLITKLAPVEYDPDAQCPLWLAFLARIMDWNEALINYLQRAVGYTLTGNTGEEVFFMPYGTGRNGKSKFLGAIEHILGDYARQTRPETLMVKQNQNTIPNDLAALKGIRFVPTIETAENQRLAESLVKQLTGGDRISARFLYSEFFDYKPTFKLWLASNHKPVIRGTDNAIWERIHLIPFDVTIPEAERDKHLSEKLQKEAPGILAWAVQGCLLWQAEGLAPPAEVRAATAAYREEMDVLALWLNECCIIDPAVRVAAGDLYSSYCNWCEANGERPLSQRAFGMRLTERGFTRARGGASGRYFWNGLGVITERTEPSEPFS